MIRDQANKTLDLYLQRIRKFGNTMADTALPASVPAGASKTEARIGTSNDKSWAGWAISSFTNKITTANGEIQPTENGSKPAETAAARSASVPPVISSPSASLEPPKQSLRPAAQPLGRSLSDRPVPVVQEEEPEETDDVFDAWGAMDDDEKDEDTFTAAVSTPKPTSPEPTATIKPAAVPYDDGGEPDFAGWLAAKSKAKAKPLPPKGLSKASSTNPVARTTTASTTKPRVVAPAKKIDTTPKDDGMDDDWGDAWD
jgi:SCY1-like protein 1